MSNLYKYLVWLLFFVIICAMLFAGWFWYRIEGPGQYTEYNSIQSEFEKIPGLKIISLKGVWDVTFDYCWGDFELKDKGRLSLQAITIECFGNPEKVCISGVGDIEFNIESKGYLGIRDSNTGQPVVSKSYGSFIQLGPKGELSHLFPFRIRNVQDVIDNYDSIYEIVEKWPIYPKQGHFKSADGTDYYYSIKKVE